MTVAAKKNLKSGRKKVQLPFLIFTVYLAGWKFFVLTAVTFIFYNLKLLSLFQHVLNYIMAGKKMLFFVVVDFCTL